MKLTNDQRIAMSMAVFLANDNYDYDPRPNVISGTGLLKSTRQIVLSKRVESQPDLTMDISTLVAPSVGSAIHDGVEKAWTGGRHKRALQKLGIADSVIERIRVYVGDQMPTPEDLAVPNMIPVYLEKRSEKAVGNFIVSGKFDFVMAGELEDHKTTGVYTYIKGSNKEDYKLQGSIYRWLNPDIITSDQMKINYTFTDWSALQAQIQGSTGYPPRRMMSVPIALMSIEDTQKFIEGKLNAIQHHVKLDESALPLCTKEELWQDDTVFKYYRNPANKGRSTKNFANFAEAQMRLIKDGSTGVIDIVRGEAKRCKYCAALPICSQAKQLIADGLLNLEG